MKILFFADIVARPGREAVELAIPKLKNKYKPDIIIANGENIAHGTGLTGETVEKLIKSGVDFFTSGNHVWKKQGKELLQDKKVPLIRPANYPQGVIGDGFRIINVLTQRIAVVSLIGRTFFKFHYDCPFREADKIIDYLESQGCKTVFVDFHCEATSEAKALGCYLDGKVSAVIGTHTHIQTSDEQIMKGKTAYITDAGMCGKKDSILGRNKDEVIEGFLKQESVDSDWDTRWKKALIQGVFLEIDKKGRAKKIQRISQVIKNP
ncbi:MAG: TIGR00282 family metallophosphoesterase [Candidatus Moranbacteria bacterium]|nr:TIGR00282 family metallophosphoesterase [Candidatus Moranbacteria bacterium]